MKIKPRCDHVERGRRCPNSAGYVPMQQAVGGWSILKGVFCRAHVGKHGARKLTIEEARRHGVPVA